MSSRERTPTPWEMIPFVDNRESGSDHHTYKITPQRGVYGSLFEPDAAFIVKAANAHDKLVDALESMKRTLFPVFLQLAEHELAGEPMADDAVLFSFMGSGASDYVTVGDFRKALHSTNEALSLAKSETPQ